MMVLDILVWTIIFTYTFMWLWYIKAYMQYDFGSYYKNKLNDASVTEQQESICNDFTKEREHRCSTVVKMILIAGPVAWIILLTVLFVGKLLKCIDKDYESTGTNIL